MVGGDGWGGVAGVVRAVVAEVVVLVGAAVLFRRGGFVWLCCAGCRYEVEKRLLVPT